MLISTTAFAAVFAFALWEFGRAHDAAVALAAMVRQQRAAQEEYDRISRRLAEANQHQAALSAQLGALRVQPAMARPYDRDRNILATIAKPWRQIALARSAKLQAQFLESERAAIPARYAALERALGLSPDQSRQLEALEIAAGERNLDIRASAESQGLAPTDPAVVTLLEQSNQALNAAAADLLGADGLVQLEDFQRTLPIRDFVNSVAGQLAFTDSPLTGAQADQLVRTLAAGSASYQAGGVADPPILQDFMGPMSTKSPVQPPVDWESIAPEVQSNLSPTQFQLLDSVMQDNRTTLQLYNMMQQSSEAPLLGFSYYLKR